MNQRYAESSGFLDGDTVLDAWLVGATHPVSSRRDTISSLRI